MFIFVRVKRWMKRRKTLLLLGEPSTGAIDGDAFAFYASAR
jgi:hypothetical protein